MTVQEVINKLKEFDSDMRVVIPGHEDGYDDVEQISNVGLQYRNEDRWYYGDHAKVWEFEKDADKDEIAVLIKHRF